MTVRSAAYYILLAIVSMILAQDEEETLLGVQVLCGAEIIECERGEVCQSMNGPHMVSIVLLVTFRSSRPDSLCMCLVCFPWVSLCLSVLPLFQPPLSQNPPLLLCCPDNLRIFFFYCDILSSALCRSQ